MNTRYYLTLDDETILTTTDGGSACDAFRSTVSLARRLGHTVKYGALCCALIDRGLIDHADIDGKILALSQQGPYEPQDVYPGATRETIKVPTEKKKAKKRSS